MVRRRRVAAHRVQRVPARVTDGLVHALGAAGQVRVVGAAGRARRRLRVQQRLRVLVASVLVRRVGAPLQLGVQRLLAHERRRVHRRPESKLEKNIRNNYE